MLNTIATALNALNDLDADTLTADDLTAVTKIKDAATTAVETLRAGEADHEADPYLECAQQEARRLAHATSNSKVKHAAHRAALGL